MTSISLSNHHNNAVFLMIGFLITGASCDGVTISVKQFKFIMLCEKMIAVIIKCQMLPVTIEIILRVTLMVLTMSQWRVYRILFLLNKFYAPLSSDEKEWLRWQSCLSLNSAILSFFLWLDFISKSNSKLKSTFSFWI